MANYGVLRTVSAYSPPSDRWSHLSSLSIFLIHECPYPVIGYYPWLLATCVQVVAIVRTSSTMRA